MALPPDPIDTVLPDATAAVVAEVVQVLEQDPQQPLGKKRRDAAASKEAAGAGLAAARYGLAGGAPKRERPDVRDRGGLVARQVVALEVKETLFGAVRPGETIAAEKPAGAYTLSAGNGGPFLLRPGPEPGKWVILGRYGPDTYPVDLIRARMKKHGKA
jgi:hypothetical protein